ncbi:hypothetical protein [Erythrobacter aureus]|uniref:Uncharacterized protein n=1 Tax=Erythrobacter aureus TaxID=2182384 RepID=A0A345YJ86_9SPHN|nr:hypothetical protein [Erythrobacter aureus]AXK43988.1 hypothetical protein DVR09_16165 [Erythrobacter aureus]
MTDRMAALLGATLQEKVQEWEPDEDITQEEINALWQMGVVLDTSSREVAQDPSRTEISGILLGDRTMDAVEDYEKPKEASIAA